jgi:hypothetical protein
VPAQLTEVGRIEDPALDEISGMARSGRDPALLWVHNDSGDKARLHAVDLAGRYRAELRIDRADNADWEDLASFTLDGRPYLLVADIGNNEGRRKVLTLYVVEEPALAAGDRLAAEPAWQIDYRYPDGPRDAEAVAIDEKLGAVYILSKRDVPPRLYRVPLRAPGLEPVDAELVMAIEALPQPARRDLEFAPLSKDWYWQPTAMDAAPDGSFVAVLTYGAVYYFRREPGAGIDDALASPPLRFALRGLRDAEALAIGDDSRQLFITVEARRAPLLRIGLGPDGGTGE